jgi:EAL domain-containing protein (putative c-di-GMP-specific phosphodiesterase class I)
MQLSAIPASPISLDELARALDLGELHVVYQPQFGVSTQRFVAAEALVRWQHPGRGLLPPSAFIELAETGGLMSKITEFVLGRACRDAVTWPPIDVAVNISPVEFSDSRMVSRIEQVLRRSGFPASRLVIEIVESAAFGDPVMAGAQMHDLRSLGIRMALDDFGTGHSSLPLLQKLPFDVVKIDKSFIDALPAPDAAAIVLTMISLVHGLGMQVTGEGVETAEQERFLTAAKCDYLQGYLFSRPIEAEQIPGRIAQPWRPG